MEITNYLILTSPLEIGLKTKFNEIQAVKMFY